MIPSVRRICAWCGTLLGESPAPEEQQGSVTTHGLCGPCAGESGMVPVEDLFSLSPDELNSLPFGAIEVDREGTILSYNQAEQDLSGIRPAQVVGRNFFSEVAPCTSVKRFEGLYREMAARGESDNTDFSYLFRFAGGSVFVHIALYYDAPRRRGLILVKKLD